MKKSTSTSILAVLTVFLTLGKIQDGGQDGDHVWWRHRPPSAPPPIKHASCCREDQRLSTNAKISSKHYNISETLGKGSINPPPACTKVGQEPINAPGWGYDFNLSFPSPCDFFTLSPDREPVYRLPQEVKGNQPVSLASPICKAVWSEVSPLHMAFKVYDRSCSPLLLIA